MAAGPTSVRLGVDLEEDLSRRDFTINAMALPVGGGDLVDPFGGQADLAARMIRAVGDPLQRFAEDGLRPLRACRFAAQLGFEVESATLAAIPQRLEVARKVAVERVFTELDKLLRGSEPHRGLALLAESGLMDLWLPELRPMIGCGQNRHHRSRCLDPYPGGGPAGARRIRPALGRAPARCGQAWHPQHRARWGGAFLRP